MRSANTFSRRQAQTRRLQRYIAARQASLEAAALGRPDETHAGSRPTKHVPVAMAHADR